MLNGNAGAARAAMEQRVYSLSFLRVKAFAMALLEKLDMLVLRLQLGKRKVMACFA
jgi:hypothetical protein